MGPAERLTAECTRCGKVFETWALGTPDLDADPALGDPGWVHAAAEVTCPHCGHTCCSSGLAAERESWRT
jgi:DNA-directed RNA polymerase subunit RPC12/RpoP